MRKLWSLLWQIICISTLIIRPNPVCANGNGSIVLHIEDEESEVALYKVPEPLQNIEVETLLSTLKKQNIQPQIKTCANNTICFDNLEPGVYLLQQTKHANERQPFKTHPIILDEINMQIEETPKTAPIASKPNYPTRKRNDAILPYTGQSRWLVELSAILGSACILAGLWLKDPYEK